MRRRFPIYTNETCHVYTKSIYGYVIFPTPREYEYMHNLLRYYQAFDPGTCRSFSEFIRSYDVKTLGFETALAKRPAGTRLVSILAWCLMPTHIHMILRQESDNGVEYFMKRTLSSFSQYFNRLHNRRGPLWQSRYGASIIRSDEQLIEKINYVHNNPVKDLGFARPEDYDYSSCQNPPDFRKV